MNKNVKLTISGLHFGIGEEETNVETVHAAEYFKRNSTHYILYEEQQEGFDERSKIRIKLKEDLVELTKQGVIQTIMVFEKDKKHTARYVTPYGVMFLGIDTKDISVEEAENMVRVSIMYRLEAEGQYLSDCRIEMRAEALR